MPTVHTAQRTSLDRDLCDPPMSAPGENASEVSAGLRLRRVLHPSALREPVLRHRPRRPLSGARSVKTMAARIYGGSTRAVMREVSQVKRAATGGRVLLADRSTSSRTRSSPRRQAGGGDLSSEQFVCRRAEN